MVKLDKSDEHNKEIGDCIYKFDVIRALLIYMLYLVNTSPFVYRAHDANDQWAEECLSCQEKGRLRWKVVGRSPSHPGSLLGNGKRKTNDGGTHYLRLYQGHTTKTHHQFFML